MSRVVTLAPPGAGIPWLQRKVGGWQIRRAARGLDEERAIATFRREGEKLLALARELDAAQLCERVLVPPQRGLEDSSRYWSIAMTLQHLVIVGELMAEAIVALSHGRVPAGRVDTAAVKPPAIADAQAAVDGFAAFLERTEARLGERARPMATGVTLPHPWFGGLEARHWLLLIGVHQRIHRRQAEAIRAGLGRPGPRVVEAGA